jgi:choline-sulfatase
MPGRANESGFTVLTSNPSHLGQHTDSVVSKSAQAFLRDYSGDKPFFLNVGLLQPHDCCYWITTHAGYTGGLPYAQIKDEMPTLPENFECDNKEPQVLRDHLEKIRRNPSTWTDEFWRYYVWSYYRHVEMADAELGRILDALENSKHASNTLIVWTVDHGDGLARRKLVTKFFTYDEAIRVPMVVCLPGAKDGGKIDRTHLVSGLDVAPTLCDFAGVEAPPLARGRSLRPLVEGRSTEWREFIVSECLITGRMLRTPEYKFVAFKDDPIEQLFDMRTDPWEMKSLAEDAKHAGTVSDLRKRLADWESKLVVA